MASPSPVARFHLRAGESGDLDQVMAVMDAAFGAEFGEAWTRSQLTGILPMAGVALTVAVVDPGGGAAGFSLDRSVADEAELLLIAVHPACRRQGIGARLVDYFIDRAQAAGLAKVHLEVRDGNPAATMYRGLGFEPVGRRPNYYQGQDGARHDAITFSRNVPVA